MTIADRGGKLLWCSYAKSMGNTLAGRLFFKFHIGEKFWGGFGGEILLRVINELCFRCFLRKQTA